MVYTPTATHATAMPGAALPTYYLVSSFIWFLPTTTFHNALVLTYYTLHHFISGSTYIHTCGSLHIPARTCIPRRCHTPCYLPLPTMHTCAWFGLIPAPPHFTLFLWFFVGSQHHTTRARAALLPACHHRGPRFTPFLCLPAPCLPAAACIGYLLPLLPALPAGKTTTPRTATPCGIITFGSAYAATLYLPATAHTPPATTTAFTTAIACYCRRCCLPSYHSPLYFWFSYLIFFCSVYLYLRRSGQVRTLRGLHLLFCTLALPYTPFAFRFLAFACRALCCCVPVHFTCPVRCSPACIHTHFTTTFIPCHLVR